MSPTLDSNNISKVINSVGQMDGCGAEVSDEELYRCGECGKKYCEECAVADGVIKTLGVCSDCEDGL